VLLPVSRLVVVSMDPLRLMTSTAISTVAKPPDLTICRSQLFKHLDCSTTVTLSLNRSYNIVRRAPEKTRSALANIASIERILMAIYKRRGYLAC
jgi:hypothetical protein